MQTDFTYENLAQFSCLMIETHNRLAKVIPSIQNRDLLKIFNDLEEVIKQGFLNGK